MNIQEKRKLYYETNKEKIAEKLYKKEECPICQRSISHQNVNKHMKTSYCLRRKNKLEEKKILDAVRGSDELYKTISEMIN